MDERYSGHDIALFKACLSPEIFPSVMFFVWKQVLQIWSMMKSGEMEVDEDVIHTSILDFLRYGGERSISSFKKIMTITVLSAYVPECPLIGYQT